MAIESKKNAPILKPILMVLVLVVSYVISVITSSFYETNKKLVILVICFVLGIILFFVIYFIAYAITLSKIKKRARRMLKLGISCDDNASIYFEKRKYKFHYDRRLKFSANIENVKRDALSVIKDVATVYGNHDEKYYYLGFTVYDATSIMTGALDLIDSKISPIFKLIRAEDKPLKIVENLLEKAIENDEAVEVEPEKSSKPSLLKKIGLSVMKASTFIFRGKIESAMTDVVKFIGVKAFETFEKNGEMPKWGELK
ncbi:MAG: hypothetical protein J6V66_06635 [Clostridia bacterium]|nr:hypothetical protein [Clostridia bacterium]